MVKAKCFLCFVFLLAMCIRGLADDQKLTCPLCGQNTIAAIVNETPNMQKPEKTEREANAVETEKDEKLGCVFCHRYIEPYLERVRQLLMEYPGRKLEPKAKFLNQVDFRILRGWRCVDEMEVFASKGRVKFKLLHGFQYDAIPLLTPTENNFWLTVLYKTEDLEIFEYLRKNLYANTHAGFHINDKLKKDEPDWDYIMAALHCLAAIPESRFAGVSGKNIAFSAVEEYLQCKKHEFSVQEYKRNELSEMRKHLVRKRFRDVCDLESADAPPWLALSIRNKKLQFDAPAFQNPDERKALIRDIRKFLETDFNAECSRILIRLLADECHSAQDLEMVGKELERYLKNPGCTGMSDEFACSILLKACIYEPKTAIRWTEMIASMLLDEDRIAVSLKNIPESEKTTVRRQIEKSVGNIYSRTYKSCWSAGDYDTAERWMSFCGDLHTKYLLASTKEHLELLKYSKEYFAFVRNDSTSPLRRAIAGRDAAAMEAILKTTKDEFLRAEAGLRLSELLLEQRNAKEAMVILRQWKSPLPNKGHVALDLSDFVNGMLSRWVLLQTKNAIALNDVSCLEGMAFGSYTSLWAGEARRLGMNYLQAHERERYERCKAYLLRAQEPLSYIILDFEDGLVKKIFQQKK